MPLRTFSGFCGYFWHTFFQCFQNPPVCFQAGACFPIEEASQMPFSSAHKKLRQNTAGRNFASPFTTCSLLLLHSESGLWHASFPPLLLWKSISNSFKTQHSDSQENGFHWMLSLYLAFCVNFWDSLDKILRPIL